LTVNEKPAKLWLTVVLWVNPVLIPSTPVETDRGSHGFAKLDWVTVWFFGLKKN